MNIGSFSENLTSERRVSITPETARKFIKEGFTVNLEKNYANHLGIKDKYFESLGVKIFEDKKSLIENSEIITQLNLPPENLFTNLSDKKTLIGVLNPYRNKEKLDILKKIK